MDISVPFNESSKSLLPFLLSESDRRIISSIHPLYLLWYSPRSSQLIQTADEERRRSVSDRVQVLNYSSVIRRQFPPTPNIRPAARHRQSTGTSGRWNIANEPFAAETCLVCLSAQTSWLRKSSSLHLNSIWRFIFVKISYWDPILMHPDWSAWKFAPILTSRNNFEDLFKISFVFEGASVSFYKNSSSDYLNFDDSILMYNHPIYGEMFSIQCLSFSTTFFWKKYL